MKHYEIDVNMEIAIVLVFEALFCVYNNNCILLK